MKKKIVTIILLSTFLIAIFFSSYDKRNLYLQSNDKMRDTKSLSFFYQTSEGSKEYKESNSLLWSVDKYIFNSEKSKCEKGSTPFWDENSKTVNVESQISDKCSIYFDIKNVEPLKIIDVKLSSTNEFKELKLVSITFNREEPIAKYVAILHTDYEDYIFEFTRVGEYVKANDRKTYCFAKGDEYEVYAITTSGVKSDSYTFVDQQETLMHGPCVG